MDLTDKLVLHLTLKKEPFEVMVTGEKDKEFRKWSDWIVSRLFDTEGEPRHYDVVRFANGYGIDKPYFITEFKGFKRTTLTKEISYTNGLTVFQYPGDFIIQLGKILEVGNND